MEKTPINKDIFIANQKHGLELYFEIEQLGTEQSKNDRFIIKDSSQNYFNDLILGEDDREQEIMAILKVLKETTIEEMAYQYDYFLYDNCYELCKELGETEDSLLDNEYVNRIVDKKRNKVWYCLKSDFEIIEY